MPGKLLRDRRATITIIMAATFAAVIGIGAFAVEVGGAYATRIRNQRVSDSAAYAGALAYSANGNSTSAMNAAAARIATLYGLASNAVTATIVTSPTGDGNSAVKAVTTTSAPLQLARVFQSSHAISVPASAYAELKPSGAACLIGLASSGDSVTQTGGSTVTGTGCAVAAKSNLKLSGGSTLTTLGAYAGGSVSKNGGSTITTTPTANNIVQSYAGISDPVASNAQVQAAFAALANLSGSVANPTTPAGGTILAFASTPSGASDPTYPYYSGSSGNYNKGTLPCSPIDKITVAGGVTVRISATPGCNYTVANGISTNGALLQIDGTAGSWYINKGTQTYGINVTTGALTLGGATTFWIGGGVNNNGTTLTLGSATNVQINGGIINGGSRAINFTANSYVIQGAVTLSGTVNWQTAGSSRTVRFYNAVSLGSGGGTFTFGDGNYSLNGGLTLNSGPTYFGNSQLLIHGNLSVSSGASLCGTPAPCGSGTSRMTIIDDGTNTFNGGSALNIAAPLVGATYGIPGIVIAGNYTNTASNALTFNGGTTPTLAGVIYFPNANVSFSGGAVTSGSNCFEIVANVISFSGGATTASTCAGFGASVGPSVATLVQ